MQEKKRILTSFKKVFTGLNNLFWKTFKHIKSAPTSKCVCTPEKLWSAGCLRTKSGFNFFRLVQFVFTLPFWTIFWKRHRGVWRLVLPLNRNDESGTLSKSPEMEDYMEFLHAVFLLCIFVLLLELQNNSESQEQPIQYRYRNAGF